MAKKAEIDMPKYIMKNNIMEKEGIPNAASAGFW